MDLGASGVQLGTRFVTTTECDASDAFKESYVKAQEKDIEIIKSPVGMPGRAIHSHFLEKVKAGMKQPKVCPFNCIKTCDISRSPLLYRNSPVQRLQRELRERLRFRRKQCLADNRIMSVKETISELINEWKRSDQPTLSSDKQKVSSAWNFCFPPMKLLLLADENLFSCK